MKCSSRANDRKRLYFKTILEKMRQRDVPVAALLLRRSVFVGESRILRYDNTMGRKRTNDEEEIDDDEEKEKRKMKKNKKKDCRCRNKWRRGEKGE